MAQLFKMNIAEMEIRRYFSAEFSHLGNSLVELETLERIPLNASVFELRCV